MSDYNNEIKLKDILIKLSSYKDFLFRKKFYILFFTLLFAVLGVIYVLTAESTYHAEITFSVESDYSRGNSALSGLDQFGIDVSVQEHQLFGHSNILELLKHRIVVESALKKEVTINGKPDLLIEHYLEINKTKEDWQDGEGFKGVSFHDKNTYLHDSISGAVWTSIVANNLSIGLKSDDANIVSLSYASVNQEFARIFVKTLVAEMSRMYMAYKTERAADMIEKIESQIETVSTDLYDALSERRDIEKRVRFKRISKEDGQELLDKLRIEIKLLETVYIEKGKNLETARSIFLKSKPLIKVWDEPVLPLKKSGKSKKIAGFFGALLGGFLSVSYFILRKLINDALTESDLPV